MLTGSSCRTGNEYPWETRQLGVAGANSYSTSIAYYGGHVYVAGGTTGGLDGNSRTGTEDCFLTEYNSSGFVFNNKHKDKNNQTFQFGVAGGTTVGSALAIDSEGNIFVAGETNGGLGGNTQTGNTDFFVTKYGSTGGLQYTQQLGVTSANTRATSVVTDGNGNVYVAGYTTGNLDGKTLTGTTDFFVTKYNRSGVKQYTRLLGVTGGVTHGNAVTTDIHDNVYVAGYTTGNLDGIPLTGTTDFFVTKYNSTGDKQYTRLLGVAMANTIGNAIATDAAGNVYIVGNTNGALDGSSIYGITDFFFTKYNSTGDKQYTRQLGVAMKTTLGNGVATDTDGNVYVAGSTTGGLDGNSLSGITDFFITKYNSTGKRQYTRQLGVASATTLGNGVATDRSDNVYVAGSTTGGLDTNLLMGTRDFFVSKFDKNGEHHQTDLYKLE